MVSGVEALVGVLRRDPRATALLCDFDGTLSPIVEDPDAARPLDGVGDALVELTERYGLVAVISGRPVAFLQDHLPAGPELVGLYGLERTRSGVVVEAPGVADWRPVVDAAVAAARAELPEEVWVEHKGLSLTLHVRAAPLHGSVALEWATAASARWGLHRRGARMSVELHPPVPIDKGTVVSGLLGEVPHVTTACFVGDDVGDLPALAAIESFATGGRTGVRAVVASDEATPELLASADVTLSGPAAVLDLLRALSA